MAVAFARQFKNRFRLGSCRQLSGRWRGRMSSSHSERTPSGLENIYNRIKVVGPMTVAEYMRECLLHPMTGYYMQRDVFGVKGDFTTSPEISQVFGELLSVWVLADWMSAREPASCRVVELGPGRGTLAKDMLRVFGQFPSVLRALSLHLIEVSPALSAIQEDTLTGETNEMMADSMLVSVPYKSCSLASGVEVSWYQRLEDVPRGTGYSYFIAHEFFDALPVHQFQRTPSGWREVLVDIDQSDSSTKALQFVLAPAPTPASASYGSLLSGAGKRAEVCPEGLALVKGVAERVKREGGAALIVDYGDTATAGHSLRGFKCHELHDVLVEPGSADLTADVDFGALKRAVLTEGAGCFGPMTQTEFLHRMGIRQRLDALLVNATPTQSRELLSSYEMLTSPEKMGYRFKFMAITPSPLHCPTPFTTEHAH